MLNTAGCSFCLVTSSSVGIELVQDCTSLLSNSALSCNTATNFLFVCDIMPSSLTWFSVLEISPVNVSSSSPNSSPSDLADCMQNSVLLGAAFILEDTSNHTCWVNSGWLEHLSSWRVVSAFALGIPQHRFSFSVKRQFESKQVSPVTSLETDSVSDALS